MKLQKLFVVVLLGYFMYGCTTVKVAQLTNEEVKNRINQDMTEMFSAQEPIIGALTLEETIARALKYNLDHRVKLMEIATSQRIHELASYNMLPTLALDAGYNARSNYTGGRSQSLITGRQSLESSTSQEKQYQTAGLNLIWNVLDFGVSHVTAKQKANEVMIAKERLRRVTQNIMRDVHDAFWRASASQRLLEPVKKLLQEAKQAREKSQLLISQRLQNPEIALNYQKRLLETIRQLLKLQEELLLAKVQLAALINLHPGTKYEIAVIESSYEIPSLNYSLEELEKIALKNQPELREEDYTHRINQLEVKKAFLRMFPGIEISIGGQVNSNEFLYNKNWFGAGLRVTWNLLNVFMGGPEKLEAESHVILSQHRRMALTMAILTQLWVSYERFFMTIEDFKLAQELFDVNKKLKNLTEKGQQAKTRSQLDVIFAQTETLMSQMTWEMSYAEMRAALAQVFHTLGVNILPNDITPYQILTSEETKKYMNPAPEPKLVKDIPSLTEEVKQMMTIDKLINNVD